jgi:hypothetical protein
MEQEMVLEEKSRTQAWNLTIRAEKEPDTKGLDLVGNRLNTLWRSSETVSVLAKGSYLAQTLDVTPDAQNAKLATLSGSVNVSEVNVDDVLTLQIPRQTWDYTGQKGVLLGPDEAGSIEKDYAYALAEVTVTGVTPGSEMMGTLTTTNAHFVNQQAIYRLNFKNGDAPLAVKDVTLSSSKGKIVLSRNLAEGTTTYGSLTVNMESSSADPIYVALRNDDKTAQDYFFSVTGADGLTYTGKKTIPAEAFSHGFLGIQDMALTKLLLSKSDTQVAEAL